MGLNVRVSHIIYLTPLVRHGQLAERFVEEIGCKDDINVPFQFSWSVISSPLSIFSHIKQSYDSGNSPLSIIIDYKPISNIDPVKRSEYYNTLRDTILFFPEFNFFFDETLWDDTQSKASCFLDFFHIASQSVVFGRCGHTQCISGTDYPLYTNLHEFRFYPQRGFPGLFFLMVNGRAEASIQQFIRLKKDNWNPFRSIVLGKDNLFDASNLRYYLKKQKYDSMSLQDNFKNLQDSRAKYLALCVEEERGQSLFNCLALYLSGFRVFPITSATELSDVNVRPGLHPDVIVRDYDLQFADSDLVSAAAPASVINLARGWNYNETTAQWSSSLLNDKKNPFWSSFIKTPVIYISKGFENKDGERVLFFDLQEKLIENNSGVIDGRFLILPGMDKPVSGLFVPFHNIPLVKNVYDSIEMAERKNHVSRRRKEKGGHSVPLDLYNMVKAMVERAEKYYEKRRYIHSAIVASEAIEVLNGFHQSLSLRAYRCQALAENAASANILGTDEIELSRDTSFRLRRVSSMISRFSSNSDTRMENSKNTLNQIYNDIRIFCQTQEHFEAENAVVSAMGHLNEGKGIINTIKEAYYTIKEASRGFARMQSDRKSFIKSGVENEIGRIKNMVNETAGRIFTCEDSNITLKKKELLAQYKKLTKKRWQLVEIKDDKCVPVPCSSRIVKSLNWSSSDDSVASIDNGVIKPKKSGDAVIFGENSNRIECFPIRVFMKNSI